MQFMELEGCPGPRSAAARQLRSATPRDPQVAASNMQTNISSSNTHSCHTNHQEPALLALEQLSQAFVHLQHQWMVLPHPGPLARVLPPSQDRQSFLKESSLEPPPEQWLQHRFGPQVLVGVCACGAGWRKSQEPRRQAGCFCGSHLIDVNSKSVKGLGESCPYKTAVKESLFHPSYKTVQGDAGEFWEIILHNQGRKTSTGCSRETRGPGTGASPFTGSPILQREACPFVAPRLPLRKRRALGRC